MSNSFGQVCPKFRTAAMAARSADSRRAECLGFVDGVLALADSADDDVACLLGKAAAAALAEKQAASHPPTVRA